MDRAETPNLTGFVEDVLRIHVRVDGVRIEGSLLDLRQTTDFVPLVHAIPLLDVLADVLDQQAVHCATETPGTRESSEGKRRAGVLHFINWLINSSLPKSAKATLQFDLLRCGRG